MTENVPSSAQEWMALQLADSAFPTGGFVHSAGLEAAVQHREVRGRADLIEFAKAALSQSARGALPFVGAAYDQGENFASLDEYFDAFTTNHVANRASRTQGRAFLTTTSRAFSVTALSELWNRVQDQSLPGHFAVVFGAVLCELGFDRQVVLRLFLFTQLRGILSSAVRLNIVGPLEAQGIQWALAPTAESELDACANIPFDRAAQCAPLLDLFQGTQDRLYSRLFQS